MVSYDESAEEHMFGIPADRRPRFVSYRAALDNYEPVPRRTETGRLVAYDDPELEISGQVRFMRATDRSDIPAGSVFIIDDGLTARPYYGGSYGEGKPSPLYPEGREPYEILYPFPVNPDGRTRPDNGRVIDFSGWVLGPRKAYLLKITPEPTGEYARIPHAVTCRKCKLTIEQIGGRDG